MTLRLVDISRTATLQHMLVEYTYLKTLPVYTYHLSYLSLPDTCTALYSRDSRAFQDSCPPRTCQETEAQSESQLTIHNTSKKGYLPHSKTITTVVLLIPVINSLFSTLTFVSGSYVTEDPTNTEDVSGPHRYGGGGFVY